MKFLRKNFGARLALRAAALFALLATSSFALPPAPASKPVPLFDGRTLEGWEGNLKLWRVEDGAITGGSLEERVQQNDFLCTTRGFTNFVLRLEFKLTGTEGFINSGIQIRSKRAPNSSEVTGYQCDLGDPDWWGAIYDEHRRNRVLFPTDMIALNPVLRRGGWNEYVIRADGPRLTLWINGVQTADYYEPEPHIADSGIIGIQVHSGGKAIIQVREISIEELPPTPPNGRFFGAPDPGKAAKASPLTPEEQKAAFTLPPGFEIELVASEVEGVEKPITVVWDAAGRMWTMTAVEYPVDANDNKEIAAALYSEPRQDRVLVFDQPFGPGPHTPRVFAEGLAIPLGLLPYKDGAFVQHGPDIVLLRDTNGDGRADQRDAVLTGFGIGDSHLMPHQFTRAPGAWILVAQGAFNNSQVRTKGGETHVFNRTLMGRFTPDGMKFDTIGWGPCNIWGLVLNGEGEIFIQEANDYGYPIMPFHEGAFYPGCTPAPKPYAPVFPGISRQGMGGTGLSGLALSDPRGGFPGAYADVFYIANPVTQRIQAVQLSRDGGHYTLVKLPDFVRSSDEWFRPVAIHFGPDGCLYIVDWYNKIISHNEIPRNHPERDKTRGRIWRVRHQDQTPRHVADFTKLAPAELVSRLGGDSLPQSHLAWQELIDRGAQSARPQLAGIVRDAQQTPMRRIQALWALEGLKGASAELLRPLLSEPNRNLRREAVRVFGAAGSSAGELLNVLEPLANDSDPEVRAEVIRAVAPLAGTNGRALAFLVQMAQEPLEAPVARSPRDGWPMKVREAYDRDFERYLIRATLEKHPAPVAEFLASNAAEPLPLENRLLAALALDPKLSASHVAGLLPSLARPAGEEELLRLAQFVQEPGVGEALKAVLQNPITRTSAAEALLRGRTRLDTTQLTPLMAEAAAELLNGNDAARELALRLASGFQLKALEPRLVAALEQPGEPAARQLAMLRALREMGSGATPLFARLAAASPHPAVREEAITTLASGPAPEAARRLFDLWPNLAAPLRRSALDRLSSSKSGAEEIVKSARSGVLPAHELDVPMYEKLLTLLGDDPGLKELLDATGSVARPVLRLDGNKDSYVDSNITLQGPFTVETWIRLDPGISNEDGILGRPGGADFNFFDGRFRIFAGPGHGDRIVAKRKMTPEWWTHLAVTHDAEGHFKIYLDGRLDTAESRPLQETFTDLDIGRVSPAKGTAGMLAEYRVWNRSRTEEEIAAGFNRSFEGEPLPAGLAHYFPGGGPWGKLNGNAQVVRTLEAPPLLTASEAREQEEKLTKYRALALRTGDVARGQTLAALCTACHTIRGDGGEVGPDLSGAGAMSLDAFLRSTLFPNVAMEAGYRVFRVELKDDEVLDGFLVSQDKDAIILRIPNSEDRRVPRQDVLSAGFLRRSLMPEGLLEALPEKDVIDLVAYLRSLQ